MTNPVVGEEAAASRAGTYVRLAEVGAIPATMTERGANLLTVSDFDFTEELSRQVHRASQLSFPEKYGEMTFAEYVVFQTSRHPSWGLVPWVRKYLEEMTDVTASR